MKVFISQPMSGRSDNEIYLERQMVEGYLKFLYGDNKLEIIDNFHKEIPTNDGEFNKRIYCLGDSIKQLAYADAIIFIDSRMALDTVLGREKTIYEDPNGVVIEKQVAKLYNLQAIDTISYHNQIEFYRIHYGKTVFEPEIPKEEPKYPKSQGIVDLDSKVGKDYQGRWKND